MTHRKTHNDFNRLARLAPIAALLGVGLLALGAAGLAFGDDDDDDDRRQGKSGWFQPRPDFPPVADAAYAEECGACHLAYQPGLLPSLAWARIMDPAALSSHYGEDATLPVETINAIAAYLTANAADQIPGKRAKSFAAGAEGRVRTGETLPRITAHPYFIRKHDEVPARLVQDNPEVKSFSQCNLCHRQADTGSYDEDRIDIPGHGPWKD